MKKFLLFIYSSFLFVINSVRAQSGSGSRVTTEQQESKDNEVSTYYGTASFYADKFENRKTASGESYDPKKLTAACNVLPLGTWIRVTNLKNNKSIIVKINDRLHAKMNRLVDLSKIGAEKLGYVSKGLAKVQVEVLGKKRPKME